MYDPSPARFLSEDPLGFDAGDTNLYRYVFNYPTNYTDPYGKQAVISPPPVTNPPPITPPPTSPPPGTGIGGALSGFLGTAAATLGFWLLLQEPVADATLDSVDEDLLDIPNPNSCPSPENKKDKWSCTAKCNVEGTQPHCWNKTVGGFGVGRNQPEACRNAKRDANQRAPRGCYARHCGCKCQKR